MELFRNASIPSTKVARPILRRIEISKMTTEELNVANPKRVHVEHIYPQKPKAGEKWDGHNKVINRIGNLSLLSARINKEL